MSTTVHDFNYNIFKTLRFGLVVLAATAAAAELRSARPITQLAPIGAPMKVTQDDLDTIFFPRYITPEIVDEFKVERVDSLDGGQLIGRNHGDFAGLVLKYFRPGSDQVRQFRLRVDHPPIDCVTGKPDRRYLSAPGAANMFFVSPRSDPALLADPTMPVLFTEGELKTMALTRAARELGANGGGRQAFLSVGLAGVWNWKGTNGVRIDARGRRVPKNGPIDDFEWFLWKGRRAVIVFDNNTRTNGKVRYARQALAAELNRRAVEVWLVDLPVIAGVNGADDFLYLCGLARFEEVLQSAYRYDWRSELLLTQKGKISATLANAITALRGAPEWAGVLAYDQFGVRVTAMREAPWGLAEPWTDQEDRKTTNWLQHHGILIKSREAGEAVQTVAHEWQFHPVREYLAGLRWDGTARIDTWLNAYLGVAETEFSKAVGAKWLISAVARAAQPGCKADHVLILEGPQGQGKSTALRILGEPYYTDDVAALGTKDAAIGTQGVWIVELAELEAMTKQTEINRVKAFVSRSVDRFRPPYGRYAINHPRQCVFAGSVNDAEYLTDATGGRRFWPVTCGQLKLDNLRCDRDQLWAETVHRYRKGDKWWLEGAALIQAASEEQEARYQRDAWQDVISDWIAKRTNVTTAQILKGALGKPTGVWTHGDVIRVGVVLRLLGWRPNRPKPNEQRVYNPPPAKP